jgi:hypothetical protein
MSSTRWLFVLALATAAGCNGETEDPQFDCSTMSGTEGLVFCDDFNDGTAPGWMPEGGSWMVQDGRYVGSGPATLDASPCAVSHMTASLRDGSEAADLAMHAELGSLARLDKTIVLRETDPSNRIELNFRGAPLNDLVVQELVGCELVYLTEEGEIAVEQPEGERIDVEVELSGDHLVVRANDDKVLERDFDFANDGPGSVGVAVIDSALTTFDDVWMRRL